MKIFSQNIAINKLNARICTVNSDNPIFAKDSMNISFKSSKPTLRTITRLREQLSEEIEERICPKFIYQTLDDISQHGIIFFIGAQWRKLQLKFFIKSIERLSETDVGRIQYGKNGEDYKEKILQNHLEYYLNMLNKKLRIQQEEGGYTFVDENIAKLANILKTSENHSEVIEGISVLNHSADTNINRGESKAV